MQADLVLASSSSPSSVSPPATAPAPAPATAPAMARSGYVSKVALVYLFVLVDLVLSGLADFGGGAAGGSGATLVYAFVGAQAGCPLIVLLLLFMLFFGTYLFQVGLVSEVVRHFRPTLLAVAAYLAVFSAYAGVKLYWLSTDGPDGLWQRPVFAALAIAQKVAAVAYYAFVLEATERLGEAKYYQKEPWAHAVIDGTIGRGVVR